jgi:hypothetical protein
MDLVIGLPLLVILIPFFVLASIPLLLGLKYLVIGAAWGWVVVLAAFVMPPIWLYRWLTGHEVMTGRPK